MKYLFCLIWFALILININQGIAQNTPAYKNLLATDSITPQGKRVYKTQRFTSAAPKIDGKLNDAVWEEGNWTGSYLQHKPVEGAQPTNKTHMKILYDDKNLYVAFRVFDDVDKIDFQRGRRDAFLGDFIGICLDSYFDKQTAFEFNINPGGQKMDVVFYNEHWDDTYNPVWEGKTAVEDSAWTAEYRIPLSQIRYSNKQEQIWGLHSWRWVNRLQEDNNWNLIPVDNPGVMYSIGELHGIKNLPKNRRIELLPYALGKMDFYEKEEGNPYATGFDKSGSIGLNGKIGLGSDFTIDFAINPDFGQVEADPAQLNLSAYETFFQEKRPFFLEGKGITEFRFDGGRLFYSRRIGQAPGYSPDMGDNAFAQNIDNTSILGAVKLTGKTKSGLSIGIIEGLTQREFADTINNGNEGTTEVEPLTNYLVGRVKKEINKGNTIVGGILTNTTRFFDNNHLKDNNNRLANTGGIDFRHHWKDKKYFIDAKTFFSTVQGSPEMILDLQTSSARYYQRPDASHLSIDSSLTHLSGIGADFEIGKRTGGNWRYGLEANYKSPGLELNDMGFLNRADAMNQSVYVSYVVPEAKGRLREYNIGMWQWNGFNSEGEYLSSAMGLNSYFKFNNRWNYNFRYSRTFDHTNTNILRGGPSIYTQGFHNFRAGFNSDGSKRFNFGFNYRTLHFDSKQSEQHHFSPGLTWRLASTMKLSSHLTYSLVTGSFEYVDDGNDNEYLMATQKRKTLSLTLRFDYAITPELTLQYYANPYLSVGKYSRYKLITDPTSKTYDNLYYEFASDEEIHDHENNRVQLSHNGVNLDFENPDFNSQQYRSNFVARWEYRPGSTLYFVWSHGRSQYQSVTNQSVSNSLNELMDITPENVFLVKFNYWLAL